MKKYIIAIVLGLMFYVPVHADTSVQEQMKVSLIQVIQLLLKQVSELQKQLAIAIVQQSQIIQTQQVFQSTMPQQNSSVITQSEVKEVKSEPVKTQVVSKSKIDISVRKDYSSDKKTVVDMRVYGLVYDEQGVLRNDLTVNVSSDSIGFERPYGYTDGQTPTVIDYDFLKSNGSGQFGGTSSYDIYFEPRGHGTVKVTYSISGSNVSNSVNIDY